ncbi:MAG: metalloregulator ArsR/SmtB family transcription factor [Saprospiraceae bacterium]|jgi:ArsR family transcriptional regulator|nr:metalloregulator ArsR/SmtB family transcription factor [Saprospiraceae bacterium]
MNRTKVTFNNEKLQLSCEIVRALAHPLRLKILEFIDTHRRINVNKIYNTLKIEQSITSQHLRILRLAGIVHAERDGKFIHYTLDYEKIRTAQTAIDHFYGRE